MKKLIFALIILLLPSMAMAFPPMPKGASVGGVNVWTGTNTWTGTATFDDITVGGGNINTGNIPLIIGDNTTDSITLRTDGGDVTVPEGTIILETTTSDIDPDRLTGDASDDGKVDQDIIEGMGASATPGILLADSDASATGTATLSVDAYTAGQDSILQVRVDDSTGEDTVYMEVDGVTEQVEMIKPLNGPVIVPTYKHAELNDTSTPHVLIVKELQRTILTNYGAEEAHKYDFPALAEGWSFIFVIEAAQNVTLDPETSTVWYLNGTALAGGKNIVNTSPTVGERISCFSTENNVFCGSGDADWASD